MPKLRPAPRRLDALVEVLHAAYAHRLAVSWLVMREAGLDPEPHISSFGADVMGKWRNARNLPQMLRDFQPHAQLMYRLRALCLQLHRHPSAVVCGGPEQWWQRVLEEGILCALCEQLAPQLFPDQPPVRPRNRATCRWWMRRGINPCNPLTEPATWALIEAVQARIFRGRGETRLPSEEAPLPLPALNGAMSLHHRKALLAKLTGCADGWTPYTGIELYRDWSEVLLAWQAMDKQGSPPAGPQRYTLQDVQRFEAVAVLIHDLLIPPLWATRQSIREGLEQIGPNKASDAKGFWSVEKSSPRALQSA
jgi:hypothetical protein